MRALAIAVAGLVLGTVAAATDDASSAPAIRDVTPQGFTPAPKIDGPLVRIPPPVRPAQPARWWRFSLPVTTNAATFVTNGTTIEVSGVVPPAVGQTCQTADGTDWPCGQAALTGLRQFLRGRDVECYYPPLTTTTNVVAPCRVGPTDVGEWLLTAGWATPSDLAGDDYKRDATQAQCAGRGIWKGDAAPATCAATN